MTCVQWTKLKARSSMIKTENLSTNKWLSFPLGRWKPLSIYPREVKHYSSEFWLGGAPGGWQPWLFEPFFRSESYKLHSVTSHPVFLPDRGIVALPHFFRKCHTRFSPRGLKGAKKAENILFNIHSFLFNIKQNIIGYGIFIQTLNIILLSKKVWGIYLACSRHSDSGVHVKTIASERAGKNEGRLGKRARGSHHPLLASLKVENPGKNTGHQTLKSSYW